MDFPLPPSPWKIGSTCSVTRLEKSGRKDHREGEGLSPRTVRYLHTTIYGILRQAVKDGLLARAPRSPRATPSPANPA